MLTQKLINHQIHGFNEDTTVYMVMSTGFTALHCNQVQFEQSPI